MNRQRNAGAWHLRSQLGRFVLRLGVGSVVGICVVALAATESSLLQATLDYGGGRSISSEYTVDCSLAGFSGAIQMSDLPAIARQGFLGQLNEPPVAEPYSLDHPPDRAVRMSAALLLGSAADAEHDLLAIASVSPRSERGAIITLEGEWICYTPPAGLNGLDSFTYTVADTYGAAVLGKVSVLIADSPYTPTPGQIYLELRKARPGGARLLRLHLPAAPRVSVEASTILPWWKRVWTHRPLAEVVDFVDMAAAVEPIRFYRAVSAVPGGGTLSVSQMNLTSTGEARLLIHQGSSGKLVVETSRDLRFWHSILTNHVGARTIEFTDDQAFRVPLQFYRAVSEP